HARAVNGPTELDLALDVDHLAPAGARGRRDARRSAETKIAKLENRQAIDLGARATFGGDHYGAAANLFETGLAQAAGAHLALLDGLLHMVAADGIRLRLSSQVASLGKHVAQPPAVGAQLPLVIGQAPGRV